jgi:broad-specificity NMP kinase
MKAIIIGTSLVGKTTLIKYLRNTTKLPVSEMDEELAKLNNNVYPSDDNYKHRVLAPKVVNNILDLDEIIFFTNTDYFTPQDLQKARRKGFKVIQLLLDIKELQRRNEYRVKNDGYSDLSQWFEGMINYQDNIKLKGLVDKEIVAAQPIEDIANELLIELVK